MMGAIGGVCLALQLAAFLPAGEPALDSSDAGSFVDGGVAPVENLVTSDQVPRDEGASVDGGVPLAEASAEDAVSFSDTGLSGLLGRAPITFNVFGNLDGVIGQGHPAFALGAVDLFVTSQPHESLSMLAEVLFEAGTDQSFVVDVERLQTTLQLDPRLQLTVGRVHQALGYYNNAYHHGRWLMNSVTRPRAVAFEDDGGVLPVHGIGLQLWGEFDFGDASLGYTLGVSNGRGRNPDELLNTADYNPAKSVLAALVFTHLHWGLKVGINALYDRIPGETAATGEEVRTPQSELILGAYALLDRDLVWLLAEAYLIDHTSAALGLRRMFAGFLEARVNVRPVYFYARGDALLRPTGIDPFYEPSRPLSSSVAAVVGIGWRPFSMLLVKLEGQLDLLSTPVAPVARVQAAWSM